MIVDMWVRNTQAFLGVVSMAVTVFLAWMGYMMFKEIRKAWKMDHKLKGGEIQ